MNLQRPSLRSWLPLLAILPGIACSQSPEESKAQGSASAAAESLPKNREEILDIVKREVDAHKNRIDSAVAEGPVPLPSERRLRALLPATLPGSSHVGISSKSRENQGRVEAEGYYTITHPNGNYTLQASLNYYGKPALNQGLRTMEFSRGDELQVSGFAAVAESNEVLNTQYHEVLVKIHPELFLEVRGGQDRPSMLALLEEFDLAEMKRLMDSEALFDPDLYDEAAAFVLPRKELAELLPERFGGFLGGSGGHQEDLGATPSYSEAWRSYGVHSLRVFDYGHADVTGELQIAPESLGHLANSAGQGDAAIETGSLDVPGGRGAWARLEQNSVVWLSAHVIRGRFAVQVHGPFQEPRELDPDAPEILREQHRLMVEQIGQAEWATVDEQWDGIVEFATSLSAPAGS